MTTAIIGRWGKTLAVRLPGDLARGARLQEGDRVDLLEIDGEIRLRKPEIAADIAALFAGRSAEEWRAAYRGAYEWGDDVGREQIPD